MGVGEFADDVASEVRAILSSDFKLSVTETKSVPHSSDAAITFPNLDEGTQGVKLLQTAVLYVDMRRSTELSIRHRKETVAKLYSAFVRAMTRCAAVFGGEVQGIIGDRVMVLFEPTNCFTSAVDTATLMHSVCSYVIDKHFRHGDVRFGFGIDYGSMLVTKTGIRKHGAAQQSYRSLVWLGRPANVASKLTDHANKPDETFNLTQVRVAYLTGSGFVYREEAPHEFVGQFWYDPHSGLMRHVNPAFHSFETVHRVFTIREATPPILMSKRVYDGFRAARPGAIELREGWLESVNVEIAGYTEPVYGMNVIYTAVRAKAAAA
jgi:class 3 adenylate cyclase